MKFNIAEGTKTGVRMYWVGFVDSRLFARLAQTAGLAPSVRQTYLFDSLNLNGTATHTDTGPFCISAGV